MHHAEREWENTMSTLRSPSVLTVIVAAVMAIGPSLACATLLPVSARRDHVFDPVNRILYISTAVGTVERYDVAAKSFLTPWNIGGDLRGIDITPDGNTILVADLTFEAATDTGYIRRVNATSGNVTTLPYPILHGLSSGEVGSWDVVALSNGKAFFTTDFLGSGAVSFREWNLTTDQISTRASDKFSGFDDVGERTWLSRNANHSHVLGLESNSSSGEAFTYRTANDEFLSNWNQSTFHSDGSGAVSRDGQLYAVEIETRDEIRILDQALSTPLETLTDLDGGMIFDPDRDLLFALDTINDEIVLFETSTWSEVRRIAAGGNLLATSRFSNGVISYDAFLNTMFVSVDGGILEILSVPEPSTALLLLTGIAALSGRREHRS